MTEEEIIRQTGEVLASRSRERGKLIPILQDIQAKFGYLPREAMLEAASFLDAPDSEVYSVATFYNQFRFVPPGKHQIKVCLGTACQIKGGKIILDSWQRELDIEEGETTPDREFSLERVACVGCCAMAPVSVVDDQVKGTISPTRIKGVLLSFEQEKQKANGKKEHD
ncbi:MAG TPA: NAD(P)H-dependent oxidoreductase subunit E [Dehalococcoidia bacterium]|nr:NAD(P)H-dependent oxidoreductase subunit E [Dehalococcoidia bacterium]